MYGAKLARDFDASVPDAWRHAIGSLKHYEVDRGLRRLTLGGSGSPPTLPQFIKACKQVGEAEGPSNPHPNPSSALPLHFDPFVAHANKCLLSFLFKRGTVSDELLSKLVEEKNVIASQYRDISREDEVTGAEIKERCFRAFDKLCSAVV